MKLFKPFNIPDGFSLVIDTREQLPLFQGTEYENLPVERRALKHGDYSVAGYENNIMIERKMIGDLTAYITANREKTIKKLEAMAKLEWKGLALELEEIELYLPKMFTKVPPEVFRQTLVSWEIRYGLHIYTSGNRKWIERWILDHLLKFYRIKTELDKSGQIGQNQTNPGQYQTD